MGRLLFLLPILAWAQAQTTASLDGTPASLLPTSDPQWGVVSITALGYREHVDAVPSDSRKWGSLHVDFQPENPASSQQVPVLTVCEALNARDDFYLSPVIIVGIFKSGLDETLRQDCPTQLVAHGTTSPDIGFMSAIALTRPTDPPESLRAEIEKKRQVILNSGPPGAHPRPERVVALYGRLVSPSGLTSIPCCTAPVEINAAPARLLGLDERDFRVLR